MAQVSVSGGVAALVSQVQWSVVPQSCRTPAWHVLALPLVPARTATHAACAPTPAALPRRPARPQRAARAVAAGCAAHRPPGGQRGPRQCSSPVGHAGTHVVELSAQSFTTRISKQVQRFRPQPVLVGELPGSGAGVARAASGAVAMPWRAMLTTPCLRSLPSATLPPLQTRDRFSWVWHNVTNYAPYLREVGYAGGWLAPAHAAAAHDALPAQLRMPCFVLHKCRVPCRETGQGREACRCWPCQFLYCLPRRTPVPVQPSPPCLWAAASSAARRARPWCWPPSAPARGRCSSWLRTRSWTQREKRVRACEGGGEGDGWGWVGWGGGGGAGGGGGQRRRVDGRRGPVPGGGV